MIESCWNADSRFRPDMYVLVSNLSEKLTEDATVSWIGNCYSYFSFFLLLYIKCFIHSKSKYEMHDAFLGIYSPTTELI